MSRRAARKGAPLTAWNRHGGVHQDQQRDPRKDRRESKRALRAGKESA